MFSHAAAFMLPRRMMAKRPSFNAAPLSCKMHQARWMGACWNARKIPLARLPACACARALHRLAAQRLHRFEAFIGIQYVHGMECYVHGILLAQFSVLACLPNDMNHIILLFFRSFHPFFVLLQWQTVFRFLGKHLGNATILCAILPPPLKWLWELHESQVENWRHLPGMLRSRNIGDEVFAHSNFPFVW